MKSNISKLGDTIITFVEVIILIGVIAGIIAGVGYFCYKSEQERKEKIEYYIDACSKGDQTACRILRESSIRLNN